MLYQIGAKHKSTIQYANKVDLAITIISIDVQRHITDLFLQFFFLNKWFEMEIVYLHIGILYLRRK